MARRETEGAGFDPLGWMLTFSDLVTLLLTFFVMLLSMKQPEVDKLKEAFGFFTGGGGAAISLMKDPSLGQGQRPPESLPRPSVEDLMKEDTTLGKDLGLPPSDTTELVRRLQEGVSLRRDTRGTVITLANELLFQPGMATLRAPAKAAIHEVAGLLRQSDQPLAVEGHTDNIQPNPRSGWTDNWNLSLARAMSVLGYLVDEEKIDPARLRVGVLGDTRPLVPNDTPEHRAMNRRTEIVIMTNGS